MREFATRAITSISLRSSGRTGCDRSADCKFRRRNGGGAAIESAADLATHPGRGARRHGLTPIDIATATDQASAWRQALLVLDAKVGDALGVAVEPGAFGALGEVIPRLLDLPAPPRPALPVHVLPIYLIPVTDANVDAVVGVLFDAMEP